MPSNEKASVQVGAVRLRWRLVRFFAVGMLCLHALFFAKLWERVERGYPDFTVFYTAATMLRSGLGHQLYDEHAQYEVQEKAVGRIPSRHGPLPYIHPPFEALIFLPLTFLPYPQAFAVWDLLNVVALSGVAFLLRRSVNTLRLIPPWEFVGLALAFFPVFTCFLQGQDSILLLLLCTLGFNAVKRREDFLAGCWFALALFKFQFVLPVVLLMGLWRRRRTGIAFVIVSMLLVVISAGLVGWKGLLRYPAFALKISNSPGLGGVPAGFAPNLRGLALGWHLRFPGTIGAAVVLTSSVVLVFFALAKLREASLEKIELQFSLGIVVSGLVAWQTNMHDLSLLVLPLVLIGDYCFDALAREPGRKSALLFPILPLLVSPLWIVLWLAGSALNLIAVPLLWWVWQIGKEISRARSSAGRFGPSVLNSARGG